MRTIAEQLHPSVHVFVLPPGSDVAELPLLLPAEQAVQLEQVARQQGLTIGQILRRAIQALLTADLITPPLPSTQSAWHRDPMIQESGVTKSRHARRPNPMTGELNKGKRVRISRQNRLPYYQPGDTGTIEDIWNAAGGQNRYYLVLMDRDDPPRPILFAEDEIESIGADKRPAPADPH